MTRRSLSVYCLFAIWVIQGSPHLEAQVFDSPMMSDPVLPTARGVNAFPAGIAALWIEALGRPEVDFRLNAATAIAHARGRGMTGLEVAIPPLVRELERPDQHPLVTLTVAKALVTLDARDSAESLMKAVTSGSPELREIVEPVLAKWKFEPAGVMWRQRLDGPFDGRGGILAIQSLATLGNQQAVPRLRELVLMRGIPTGVRLAAARALAVLRDSGLESDAGKLRGGDRDDRLAAASLLRRHSGETTVGLLKTLATDAQPVVATIALERMNEIDPNLVLAMLDTVLSNPDAKVRLHGVEAMFHRPSDALLKRLGDQFLDAHPDVRDRARRAVRDLGMKPEWKNAAIRETTRGLASDDWRPQEQGALLAGELDYKPAARRIVDLLPVARAEVTLATGWALRRLAVPETLGPVLAYMNSAIADGSTIGKGNRNLMAIDQQIGQLGQFIGLSKYEPAVPTLKSLVPFPPKAPPEARAAAVWALGKIFDGKTNPELGEAFATRIRAVAGVETDDPLVRRMAAISLARIKASEELPTLRQFYPQKRPTLDQVSNACGWAIEQITGEKMPEPGTVNLMQRDWFLMPIR